MATSSAGRNEDLLASTQAGPAAARAGVIRIAGYAVGVALSVGSAALLFRHLGVADAGRYVTVLSLVALFGGLTEAGLASIAVREIATSRKAERTDLLRDLLGLRIVLSFVAAVAAVIFSIAVDYPAVMAVGTGVVAGATVLTHYQATVGASLQARLRFGWITALDLWRQVILVVAIVVLVLADASLGAFFVAVAVSGLGVLVPTVLLVRDDFPLVPRFRGARWRAILRTVAPYAAATAVTAIYFRISLVLLSLMSTDEEVGYFSAAFRVTEVILIVPVMAVGAAFPIFARAATEDLTRLRFGVQRVFIVSFVSGIAVVLGCVVGAPDIVAIVGGDAFEPAVDVLRLQSLGLLGSFGFAVWSYALLSMGRFRALLLLAFIPLIVNVALTLLLVRSHGAMGASAAIVTGELLLSVSGFAVLQHHLKDLRLDSALRALALALPCAAVTLIPGVPTLALAALAATIFLALVWVTRTVPHDVLDDLRRRDA